MTTPEIQAAAEQASENLSLETSAVVAEAAAESAVIAAESAIQLAHTQAAIVINDAKVEIAEHVEQVEILEGSLEWLKEQVAFQNQAIQSLVLELQTMREATVQSTQLSIAAVEIAAESTAEAESLSSTLPTLETVTETANPNLVPSQSEVVDAPPEVVAEKSQVKKKRLNLL